MAEVELLSECLKGFINALTARPRQQFKALLYSYKQLLQIELAKIQAMLAAQDRLSSFYTAAINGLDETLKPLEAALSQIPFKEFKACDSVTGLDLDIQNIYLDKKNELRILTYKYAQFGFANTYFGDLRNNIENKLDQLTTIITYIDNLATSNMDDDDPVIVYTNNTDAAGNKYPVTRTGKIATNGINGIYITVTMDDTGANETFDATEVQVG